MIRPKDRMINALKLKKPLDYIPTFDANFELAEAVGKRFHCYDWNNSKDVQSNFDNLLIGKKEGEEYKYSKEYLSLTIREKEKTLIEQAETYIELAGKFDWAGITVNLRVLDDRFLDEEIRVIKEIKRLTGNDFFIVANMKFGTMAIPNSTESIWENAIQIKEEPEKVKERLEIIMNKSLSRARRFIDAGCDGILEVADYATNSGLYYSSKVVKEFIIPNLLNISETVKKWGAYFIKHTDGDYMEIFDDIIDCKPGAIHSLQKVGKMDSKIIKEKTRNKVCLIGNISSRILESGTIEEVQKETFRSIEELSPGGGFVLSADNCIFKDIPIENYEAMINKWKEVREVKYY